MDIRVLSMASLIFYGTGNIAATVLSALIRAGHEIRLVVCEPDLPMPPEALAILQHVEIGVETGFYGRRPVAVLAEKLGLETIRPGSLKGKDLPQLGTIKVDVGVACEYGLLIPKRLLELPAHGTLNLHPSMLPRYRGPTPIQSVLLNGETETGVTVILMDERFDCGPILSSAGLKIPPDADAYALEEKLAALGAALLADTLPGWLAGEIQPVPQDESRATSCRLLSHADGRIDWSKTQEEICRQFRALHIWSGVWSVADGQPLDFFRLLPAGKSPEPGVMSFQDGRVFIGCGDGAMEATLLRKGHGGFLEAKEFIRRHPEMDGRVLG